VDRSVFVVLSETPANRFKLSIQPSASSSSSVSAHPSRSAGQRLHAGIVERPDRPERAPRVDVHAHPPAPPRPPPSRAPPGARASAAPSRARAPPTAPRTSRTRSPENTCREMAITVGFARAFDFAACCSPTPAPSSLAAPSSRTSAQFARITASYRSASQCGMKKNVGSLRSVASGPHTASANVSGRDADVSRAERVQRRDVARAERRVVQVDARTRPGRTPRVPRPPRSACPGAPRV
jgi:hypothetical protein